MSLVVFIGGGDSRGVDSIGIQEGVFSSINCFVWGHVDNIGVTSIIVCYHLWKGGEAIGLAEINDISQGRF